MAERDDCDFYPEEYERERTFDDVIDDTTGKPLVERLAAVRDHATAPLDILNAGLSHSELLEYGFIDEGEYIPTADGMTDAEWETRLADAHAQDWAFTRAHRKGRGRDRDYITRLMYKYRTLRILRRCRIRSHRERGHSSTQSHSRTRRATRSASTSRGSPSDDSDPEPPEPQAHSPPFSCPPWPPDTSTARGLIVAYLSPTRRRAQTVGRAMLGRPHGARANDKGGKPMDQKPDMRQFDNDVMDAAETKELARVMFDASGGDLLGCIRTLVDKQLEAQWHDMCEHGQDVTFFGTFGGEFHVAALRDRLQAAASIINFDRNGLLLIRELCALAGR